VEIYKRIYEINLVRVNLARVNYNIFLLYFDFFILLKIKDKTNYVKIKANITINFCYTCDLYLFNSNIK